MHNDRPPSHCFSGSPLSQTGWQRVTHSWRGFEGSIFEMERERSSWQFAEEEALAQRGDLGGGGAEVIVLIWWWGFFWERGFMFDCGDVQLDC